MTSSSLEAEIKTKTETAEQVIASKVQLLKEQMDRLADELSRKYKTAETEAKEEYLAMLADLMEDSLSTTNSIILLEKKLKELQSKHDAAVEEYKRAQEMKDKKDFYRLQLSNIDLEEIKKLREVEIYLRDARPLNKVIWSVYYENPYTDLIGRVLGKQRRTGVYKLTNLDNQMVYVGQAVNMADR